MSNWFEDSIPAFRSNVSSLFLYCLQALALHLPVTDKDKIVRELYREGGGNCVGVLGELGSWPEGPSCLRKICFAGDGFEVLEKNDGEESQRYEI